MGRKIILLFILVGVLLVGCQKKSGNPTTPSSSSNGTVDCSASIAGIWQLFSVATSSPSLVGSSNVPNPVFTNVAPGTYEVILQVTGSGFSNTSQTFSVAAGKTTSVSFDGSVFTVTGPS